MLSRIVDFFKSRQVSAKVGPKVTVDYEVWDAWDPKGPTLKREWEGLRAEIESTKPSIVKEREWTRYRSGFKRENLMVEIEGVLMKLEGPYYPDEAYEKPPKEMPKSETETANETVDSLIQQTRILWSVGRCSDRKFDALLEFLRATRATRRIGDHD